MKISLITVGKTQDKAVAELVAAYSARIERYVGFELVEVADDGGGASGKSTTDAKLAKVFDKFDRVFLLDERGREYRSVEFADLVQKQMNSGVKAIAFVVGGPFGFSDEVRKHPRVVGSASGSSSGSIALSKMTFPHDLVRAIFVEQLYRALTILKNEKYHHE